ncbi:MAG TPA: BlaI/MecI/CopY family transcriptional regulator [Bacteroidales bacterium]|nr:BlaI/MecI/CopY family transcriptional regulator [Bacteroidales bacterium]
MNYRPTQSELEILEILWEAGTATVREVNEKLEKKGKNVGYTTTLKMMQLMADKGLLSRTLNGRTHVYSAIIRATDTRNALIDRMVDAAFGGSAAKLVLQALGNYKASADELQEIKKLIDKLEKEQKKS